MVLGWGSFPAYYEQAKRIQYHDQMPYTSRTIVTGQVCLAISVKQIQHLHIIKMQKKKNKIVILVFILGQHLVIWIQSKNT